MTFSFAACVAARHTAQGPDAQERAALLALVSQWRRDWPATAKHAQRAALLAERSLLLASAPPSRPIAPTHPPLPSQQGQQRQRSAATVDASAPGVGVVVEAALDRLAHALHVLGTAQVRCAIDAFQQQQQQQPAVSTPASPSSSLARGTAADGGPFQPDSTADGAAHATPSTAPSVLRSLYRQGLLALALASRLCPADAAMRAALNGEEAHWAGGEAVRGALRAAAAAVGRLCARCGASEPPTERGAAAVAPEEGCGDDGDARTPWVVAEALRELSRGAGASACWRLELVLPSPSPSPNPSAGGKTGAPSAALSWRVALREVVAAAWRDVALVGGDGGRGDGQGVLPVDVEVDGVSRAGVERGCLRVRLLVRGGGAGAGVLGGEEPGAAVLGALRRRLATCSASGLPLGWSGGALVGLQLARCEAVVAKVEAEAAGAAAPGEPMVAAGGDGVALAPLAAAVEGGLELARRGAVVERASSEAALAPVVPYAGYQLVDARGRAVERPAKHPFALCRVHYSAGELPSDEQQVGALRSKPPGRAAVGRRKRRRRRSAFSRACCVQVWFAPADGLCRWRQTSGEVVVLVPRLPLGAAAKDLRVDISAYELVRCRLRGTFAPGSRCRPRSRRPPHTRVSRRAGGAPAAQRRDAAGRRAGARCAGRRVDVVARVVERRRAVRAGRVAEQDEPRVPRQVSQQGRAARPCPTSQTSWARSASALP